MSPRRIDFEVPTEIPNQRAWPQFRDLLAASWANCREDPVGPLESVGIGFLWYSRVREGSSVSALPRPWSLIRNGLVERLAIDPKAHVYMTRGEVVRLGYSREPSRLIVTLER